MKDGRVHIRVDKELADSIRKYAHEHRTTLTKLVEDHFRFLLDVDKVADGLLRGQQEVERHAVPKKGR